MISWTLRPSTPPLALTTFSQSLYPRCAALPGSEKSPESESEIPILIGPEAAPRRVAASLVSAAAEARSAPPAARAAIRAAFLVTTQPPSAAGSGLAAEARAFVRPSDRRECNHSVTFGVNPPQSAFWTRLHASLAI